MEEKTCTQCNQSALIRELPGQFRDFDADKELHGTTGLSLCSSCLGTGKIINSPEFQALSKEISKIRSNNLGIQMQLAKKEVTLQKCLEAVVKNNQRLREIARRGLELVKNPIEGCYAKTIA